MGFAKPFNEFREVLKWLLEISGQFAVEYSKRVRALTGPPVVGFGFSEDSILTAREKA